MPRTSIRVGQRLINWDGTRGYVTLNSKGKRVFGPGEEFMVEWLDGDGEVDERHHLAPGERPQTHLIDALPPEDTIVVRDRAVGPERRATGFVALEDLNRLGDRPHRHLGGQAKAFPEFVIAALVDRGLPEHPSIKPHLGGVAGGGVKRGHRLSQERGLLRCGK